jgi:hypothetical protein
MTDVETVPQIERVLEPSVEARQASLRFAGVGIVRTEQAELNNTAVGLVVAGKAARLQRVGARAILAAGPMEVHQAGARTLVSLGDVQIRQGGAGALVARSAAVHDGGFIGLAVTPRLNVEPGGRVLAGPREVVLLASVAGIAAFVAVLLTWLIGQRSAAVATDT